jgi:hypothetical protein
VTLIKSTAALSYIGSIIPLVQDRIIVARNSDLTEARLTSRDFGFREDEQHRDGNVEMYEQWHTNSAYLHLWRNSVSLYVAM